MTEKRTPFFIGYKPVPTALRGFLMCASLGLVALAGLTAYWIATTQDDPAPGVFRFDYGRQSVTGVIELTPVAILHVTEGNDRIPVGHTLMLSGPGKYGVMDRPAASQGQIVTVSGILLERGTMDMLQVAGNDDGLKPAQGTAEIPAPEDLGRWRLAGEICDGKCLAGAMRPGRGLAHKACANLCVSGGIPPVFVSTQPVEGSEFLMISGPDRTKIPEAVFAYMAQYISIEGRITRHGDLLVFAIEPETVKVLP